MLKDDTELELYRKGENTRFYKTTICHGVVQAVVQESQLYSLSSDKQMNVILWQDMVACFQHCSYFNCKSTLVAHRSNRQLLHLHHVWVISGWGTLGSKYCYLRPGVSIDVWVIIISVQGTLGSKY